MAQSLGDAEFIDGNSTSDLIINVDASAGQSVQSALLPLANANSPVGHESVGLTDGPMRGRTFSQEIFIANDSRNIWSSETHVTTSMSSHTISDGTRVVAIESTPPPQDLSLRGSAQSSDAAAAATSSETAAAVASIVNYVSNDNRPSSASVSHDFPTGDASTFKARSSTPLPPFSFSATTSGSPRASLASSESPPAYDARSDTPRSLCKRDEVLKRLKKEGRWSDEEDEEEEEVAENEEEEDDDIIPLDVHIKVEEFYRDILQSNPYEDGDVMIEAVHPSLGSKIQPTASSKWGPKQLQQQLLQHQNQQLQQQQQQLSYTRGKTLPIPGKAVFTQKNIPMKCVSSTKPYPVLSNSVSQQPAPTNPTSNHVIDAQYGTCTSGVSTQSNTSVYHANASPSLDVSDDNSNQIPDMIDQHLRHPDPNSLSQLQQQPSSLVHAAISQQNYNYSLQPVFSTISQSAPQPQPSTYVPTNLYHQPPHVGLSGLATLITQQSPLTGTASFDSLANAPPGGPTLHLSLADLKKLPRILAKLGFNIFGGDGACTCRCAKEKPKKVNKSTQTFRRNVKREKMDEIEDENDDDDDNDDVQLVDSETDDEPAKSTSLSVGTCTNDAISSIAAKRQEPQMPRAVAEIQKTTFPIYGKLPTTKVSSPPPIVGKYRESPSPLPTARTAADLEIWSDENKIAKKRAKLTDDERVSGDENGFEVLQSKVYLVGQGKEEMAFVQRLDRHGAKRTSVQAEDSEDEEEETGEVEETTKKCELKSAKTCERTLPLPTPKNGDEKKRKGEDEESDGETLIADTEDDALENEGEEEEEEEEQEAGDKNPVEVLPDELDLALKTKKNENGMYKCRYCDKEYTHASSRKTHERKHTGDQPFSCPSCNKGFSHPSNYRRHIKMCRGADDVAILPTYDCAACGQRFKHQKSLSTHFKFKHDRRELDCPDCGSKFPSMAYLERHKAKCTAKPSTSSETVENIATRPGRRLHFCQWCGWNSRTKKALHVHMEKHELFIESVVNAKKDKKRARGGKTRDSVNADEKPVIIDLANVKWMVDRSGS